MKKQSPVLAILVLFFFSLSYTSCKKLNEGTELGNDLIPPIDNIHTFDTTISVEAYNFLFSETEDTTTANVLSFLGNINTDPLFGKTEASIFFDLKPTLARTPFPFGKDSLIGLDSIVLVLRYNRLYGDSTLPQRVQVYEIPTSQSFGYSKEYQIRKNAITSLGSPLGPVKTFIPSSLNDSVSLQREQVANQLRIPLDKSFGNRLLNYDTSNAYASDTAIKKFFNGFAVVPQNNTAANGLVGFNLIDTGTKLSFYVRYKNAGKIDTAIVNFGFTTTSALANYIKRDYAGSELATAVTGTDPDQSLYIQNAPGSFARIKIPGLRGLNNRVVHLADLIVEQVYDPLSPIFSPPGNLYLDAFDSSINRYRTITPDVSLTVQNSNTKGDSANYIIANPDQFGMSGKKQFFNGNPITVWHFNISRYVQGIVNGTDKVRDLRLYAPFSTLRAKTNGIEQYITFNVPYAIGRVRVGGGNHPTQKMRVRLVYSKL